MISLLFVFVTSLSLVTSSAIGSSVSAEVYLKENSRTGSRVADAASLLNLPTPVAGFKLLSEKLVRSQRSELGSVVRRKWLKLDKASGVVTLVRHVDREEMCGDVKICAILLEIFSSDRRQLLNLKVLIDDVNDNRPVFPTNRIKVEVSESARVNDVISLSEYMAHDDDQGNNSLISYSISSNPYFGLEEVKDFMNTNQLFLKVKKKLDHETNPTQRMTLIARDHGKSPQESFAEVVVTITDVNDNDPEFSKQEYFVTLPENLESGKKIAQLEATDADSKDAGTLQYFVSRRNEKVARNLIDINRVTGDVILGQTLDREIHEKLRILIEARDSNSTNQRIGRTWLQINVQDVNDNIPEIEVKYVLLSDEKAVYLPEDSPPGTFIAYLTVKDPDSGENGRVDLSIESIIPKTRKSGKLKAQKPFNLTVNGFLCLKEVVDRETISSYLITIKACDRGRPQQCSNKTIDVELLDVNDHPPSFESQGLNLVLAEDTKVGSIITTIHASDKDALNLPALYENENGKIDASPFGEIYYHIINGDGTIGVDSRTGEISLMRPLDREVSDRFWVTVRAKDGGRKSALQSTCKVYVTVTDVNDNKPTFTNSDVPYYATVLRNDVVVNIQAVDYDAEENGTVTYRMLSVDGVKTKEVSSLFLLDSVSGELRLNFSNVDLNSSLGQHQINIEAADNGTPPMNSSRVFVVTITDWEQLPGPEHAEFSILSVTGTIVIGTCSILSPLIVISLILIIRRVRKSKRKTFLPSVEDLAQDSNSDFVIKKKFFNNDIDSIKDETLRKNSPDKTGRNVRKGYTRSSLTTNNSENHSQSLTKSKSHQRSSKPSHFEQVQSTHNIYLTPPPSAIPNDADSGRGDSDPDAPSSDVTIENGGRHMNKSSQIAGGGYRCTEQCLVHGHSDQCWMDFPDPDANEGEQRHQHNDVNSSLYVELAPLLPTSYPAFHCRSPAENRLVSTPCFNYPANELSSIYSDVVMNYPRLEAMREVNMRTTPISIRQEQESLRFSPTSCLSAPVTCTQRFEPSLRHNQFTQGSLKRIRKPCPPSPLSQVGRAPPLLRSASADLLDNTKAHEASEQNRTFPKRRSAKRLSSAVNTPHTQIIVDDKFVVS